MASTYYVKKNGKFPRALFAEHFGKTNFAFHMPDGVKFYKTSHSCLRSIRAGNWKLITKEEAFALKEKKVIQSEEKTLAMTQYPKYYVHKDRMMFGGGGVFVHRISANELEFVRPDNTTYDKRKWGTSETGWVGSGDWLEISKEEANKLLLKKEPEIPAFKPSGAEVYLTAGGYLVELDKNLCAMGKHSPGLTLKNNSCDKKHRYGWVWKEDGSIAGLLPEWCEKLRLVEKMPEGFTIPPETDQLVYADGYPMVRLPKKGEYYIPFSVLKNCKTTEPVLATCSDNLYYGEYHKSVVFVPRKKEMLPKYYIRHNNLKFSNNIAFIEHSAENKAIDHFFDGTSTSDIIVDWPSDLQRYVEDGRWIEITLEQGKQLIAQHNQTTPCRITENGQYELMNGKIVNLTLTPSKYSALCLITDQIKSESGHIAAWAWAEDGTIPGIGSQEYCKGFYVKRFIGPSKSVTTVGTENQKVTTGEEKMKTETAVAIAKGTGNLALRALNYWAWEPAKNMGVRVLSSIRYVTFFAGITACVLGYNYPTQTKALVKSALPKIHFSVERPELLK